MGCTEQRPQESEHGFRGRQPGDHLVQLANYCRQVLKRRGWQKRINSFLARAEPGVSNGRWESLQIDFAASYKRLPHALGIQQFPRRDVENCRRSLRAHT